MKEPFVLGDADGARWVLHPPQDPYGDDGYVLTAETELHQAGMTAKTIAQIDGLYADRAVPLSDFVEGWRLNGVAGKASVHGVRWNASLPSMSDTMGAATCPSA